MAVAARLSLCGFFRLLIPRGEAQVAPRLCRWSPFGARARPPSPGPARGLSEAPSAAGKAFPTGRCRSAGPRAGFPFLSGRPSALPDAIALETLYRDRDIHFVHFLVVLGRRVNMPYVWLDVEVRF